MLQEAGNISAHSLLNQAVHCFLATLKQGYLSKCYADDVSIICGRNVEACLTVNMIFFFHFSKHMLMKDIFFSLSLSLSLVLIL